MGGRRKINIPFDDEFYNVEGASCNFVVKDYCKWFRIHGIDAYGTEEEKTIHDMYFSADSMEIPPAFATPPELDMQNPTSKYCQTMESFHNYAIRRNDPTMERKAFMEKFKDYCINMRAEKWIWGETKPDLESSVRHSFGLAEMNRKMIGDMPYPIPSWVFYSYMMYDRAHLTELQILALSIITYFTQRRPDRGYLEYLGLIDAYSKTDSRLVRRALNDLYALDYIIPCVNDPRVCYGAVCTMSWLLNIPVIEKRLNEIGMSLNGTLDFSNLGDEDEDDDDDDLDDDDLEDDDDAGFNLDLLAKLFR